MSNQIFKKGDKVFHYHYGWGTIKKTSYDLVEDYPLTINFGKQGDFCFTDDGRELFCEKPSLSFTEYTLEGFSQERPEVIPKKGDIVWSRDDKDDRYDINHFIHKIENAKYPYVCSPDNDEENIKAFKFITTINPYTNEK